MVEPRTLKCATCGFEALDPVAMMTHMVAEKHGMSEEMAGDLADSGGFAEMASVLGMIQTNPEIGEPVMPGDDVPEEVADMMEMAFDRCEVCGKAVGYGARFLHIGRCDDHPREEDR